MEYILFAGVLFLAFFNGANDNFKGVATLFGSATSTFKNALSLATVATLLGSFASVFFATQLVKNFSGKGLIPDTLLSDPAFAASVALGAGLTIMIATRVGMPVSTTHALVGALTGAGFFISGLGFNFSKLGLVFFLPLLLSPFLAAIVSLASYITASVIRKKLGITRESCLCAGQEEIVVPKGVSANIMTLAANQAISVKIADTKSCREQYQGKLFGISAQTALDSAHFISAGTVSFARGLNDTPKIAGLILMSSAFDLSFGMILIAAAIAIGGILKSKKVAETISKKITPLNDGQGFMANTVTAILITSASLHGMPVSTTHVSVGSIFGIGASTGNINRKVTGEILLSWLFTLPLGAASAFLVYYLINLDK